MTKRTRTGFMVLLLAQGLAACDARSPSAPSTTPQPPPIQEPYTLSASAITVTPGEQLSVSWTAPSAGSRDWIGLFTLGAGDCDHGWSEYTRGATSGTLTLNAPAQPGEYEFRYLDNQCDIKARSSPVTVRAGG